MSKVLLLFIIKNDFIPLIPLFHLLASTNPTILLDVMLQALIFAYFFFKCFALFQSIMPSHKFEMSNNFRIIFIRTSITKVNIIKIFTKNTHHYPYSSLENVTLPEPSSKKSKTSCANKT